MKRVFFFLFILSGMCSSAQDDFSKCYDTLTSRIRNSGARIEMDIFGEWNNCIKGKAMPFISAEAVSGEKIKTEKLKGKVIVINFWFTSCHPCIAELPALNRLVQEYKEKDVVFLGLSTDTKEMLDLYFFPKYKFDFKIIPDALNIIQKIGSTGYPTTYIVDKQGKVQASWFGGRTDAGAETEAYFLAKPIIDELLKEGGK